MYIACVSVLLLSSLSYSIHTASLCTKKRSYILLVLQSLYFIKLNRLCGRRSVLKNGNIYIVCLSVLLSSSLPYMTYRPTWRDYTEERPDVYCPCFSSRALTFIPFIAYTQCHCVLKNSHM